MCNNFIARFPVLCLLFILTACSNLSRPDFTVATQRQYLQQIDMSGRLSAQYEENNRPKAIHIHFNWIQTPEQTEITLTSPTGQTLATLCITEAGARLNQINKPPKYAHDANQLISAMLGWPLPVAGLQNWLQGFTDAKHHHPITSATSANVYAVDGWSLRYTDWKTENHIERPKRLYLTRQTEQAGIVSLRIAIDEWNGQ